MCRPISMLQWCVNKEDNVNMCRVYEFDGLDYVWTHWYFEQYYYVVCKYHDITIVFTQSTHKQLHTELTCIFHIKNKSCVQLEQTYVNSLCLFYVWDACMWMCVGKLCGYTLHRCILVSVCVLLFQYMYDCDLLKNGLYRLAYGSYYSIANVV